MVSGLELARVEQHHAPPDDRKVVFQFEIVEDRTLRNDVFEERSQVGNVPLAVAQLVDQAVFGFLGRDLEGLVEGAVGAIGRAMSCRASRGAHAPCPRCSGRTFRLPSSRPRSAVARDVFHRQHQEFRMAARPQLARVQQHHAAPDDREGMLEFEVVEDRTLGNDIFEQSSQGGNVPLAVAQLVNQAVLGFFGRHLKSLVEGRLAERTRKVVSSIKSGSRTVSTMSWAYVSRSSTNGFCFIAEPCRR